MPTGAFWNTDNPAKPWGLFDVNSTLIFPIDIGTWLADLSSTYADHEVIAVTPLECVESTRTGDVVAVKIRLLDAAEFTLGKKYPFTLRLTTADGQVDDRTLWLKVKER